MKKILFFFLFVLPIVCRGQVGIITTIAGTGSAGFSGDGGPATAAEVYFPWGMVVDKQGVIYFSDEQTCRIRKIDLSGVVTTIAGNGPCTHSGEGIPATAASLSTPTQITLDAHGNLYFMEESNATIRKIDTSGIITNFAGIDSTPGYTGDGGPASSARIEYGWPVSIDPLGNIYLAGGNRIRKIDTSGTISAIAGRSTSGYGGDGGPASAATLGSLIMEINFDRYGNLYFADAANARVRKIDTLGIITTVAGNGSSGFSGDGGPATAARLWGPGGVHIDYFGNIYICDQNNARIRKVNSYGLISTIAGYGTSGYNGEGLPALSASLGVPICSRINQFGEIIFTDAVNRRIRKIGAPSLISDSFFAMVDNYCGGIKISNVTHSYSPGQHILTYLNDGAQVDTLTSAFGTNGVAELEVPCTLSGHYVFKQVLYSGSVAVDSISFSHEYINCKSISLNCYYDANSNCIKDSNEHSIFVPQVFEVDSNGVAIDTISCTSGLYYSAYGNLSDVYSFHVISSAPGLHITCPASGVFRDTLSTDNTQPHDIGFSCTTTSQFDLSERVSTKTGRHLQSVDMIVNNNYCNPVSATFKMVHSHLYNFVSASPAPASVVGDTISWNFSNLSSFTPTPIYLHATLSVPGSWLTVGDTVQSKWVVFPTGGDIDTSNNVIIKTDTVTGSWDPNEMSVSPAGNILPGAQLQYTVNFENTGNDTAFNIYVMDTLSDNVNPGSMRIVAASHAMTTSQFYDTTIHHNIIKFEFPNINLLDSSHHNLCDGMVIFNINTNPNLADGATVQNHAGIFFDYNPVVMTDTVVNTIALIHGSSVFCVGAIDTLSDYAPAGIWSVSNSHASVAATGIVTGVSAGIDTIMYSVSYANGIIAARKILTVNPIPFSGVISGVDSFCAGSAVTLAESSSGGIWASIDGHTSVTTSGVVTGISPGTDTIAYTVTNSCGVDSAIKRIIVKPLPFAGSITGADSLCYGLSATLNDTSTSGTWTCSNSHATVSGGVVTTITAGTDTIYYVVSNFCGSDTAMHSIVITPLPYAGTISGPDSLCAGNSVTLSESATGGTWGSFYGHATVTTTGVVTGISTGIDTIAYTVTNSCGVDSAIKRIIVKPLPFAGSITGADSICIGNTSTLSDTVAGGLWHGANGHVSVSVGGLVTAVSLGRDSVFYRVVNYCGLDSVLKPITVKPIPFAGGITGIDSVCVGALVTLHDTISTGTWGARNTYATVAAGIVTGASAGVDTIFYAVSNFCGSDTAIFSIRINPLADAGIISGVDSLCVGGIVTLSETVAGGAWSMTNSRATYSAFTVTGVSAGLDTVHYVCTNACGGIAASFVIKIISVPARPGITGSAFVCAGRQPDTLSGTPAGGVWSSLNAHTTVVGGVVTGILSGVDTVVYRITNYCGTASDNFYITIPTESDCDSIAAVSPLNGEEGVSIYPNPATHELTIEAATRFYNVCSISDVLGKELIHQKFVGTKTNINISQLRSGVYYIKLNGKGKTLVRKIVKM